MKCLHVSFRLALAAACALCLGAAHAATFTYHGSLQDSGKPAEGSYDLELTLYTSANGGSAVAGPLVLYKVPVHQGSFSTEADFGPLAKSPEQAWLSVKIRPSSGGDFASLAARAQVSTVQTASVCPGAWTLDGNAGTSPGTGLGQNYLGTADNQPLVLAINGAQAGKLAASTDPNHADSVNVVLGSPGNFVGSGIGGATVGGGGSAQVANCGASGNLPCVNSAIGAFSTVAGGFFNVTTGDTAAIGGGALLNAGGPYSAISGGIGNATSGYASTVGGGYFNTASADEAAVAGGAGNIASGVSAFVGGGNGNNAAGYSSTIGGGGYTSPANCGPGADQPCGNSAMGAYSTVAGGYDNRALGDGAIICGGAVNSAVGNAATVAGGINNNASGYFATIGGGGTNSASGDYATVSGGTTNLASGTKAFVGGGENNQAVGVDSTVAGGASNTASGTFSATGSGAGNTAGGDWSYAGGLQAVVRNAAQAGSAAGCAGNDTCGDFLTFVWSDGSAGQFASTGPQQFLIHAIGGVGINAAPPTTGIELTIAASPNGNDFANLYMYQQTNQAGIMLRSGGATSTANNDAALTIERYNGSILANDLSIAGNGDFTIFSTNAFKPGGGSWAAPSDARLKRDVQPLAHTLDRLLRLRGVTFEYAQPDDSLHPAGRHTGFIAQEVQQVFPEWIGSTPDGYQTVGPQGFEALSVEALRELRAEKDAEIAQLADDNAALHEQLDDLLARMSRLEKSAGD